ncbi:MAG: hypothetical protein AUI93_01855 [Crenarchaeota archaeon 13_1_40CM_3_52_10]|nr:MAG: hypothetical protein AUI93_01855 [Crenarchaeota archaeon 13_1_40CM_3_52_10]
MSETTRTYACSSCQTIYPTPISFRGRCSAADCQQPICENCWLNGIRLCAKHQPQQVASFPRLKTEAGPSIADFAKLEVEKMATEEALGVGMVRRVGQKATQGTQLLRPEVQSSPDGTMLWCKKKRFFRRAIIIEAEYSSSEKGVSGLRDQALRSAEKAKADKNFVLKCFTCPKPSEDMVTFAQDFSDPKMSLYLMEGPATVYYNMDDRRAQHYLKLFSLAHPNVSRS